VQALINSAETALLRQLRSDFLSMFGQDCRIFRAPGRVNLIGEHTDYNDGLVMPAAIDFATFVAAAPSPRPELTANSRQQQKTAAFILDAAAPAPSRDWTDYVRGVSLQLQLSGFVLTGANLLVDSRVPIGAGLSSSAALEVGTALALIDLAKADIEPNALARLCQRAENEFVGARCGIMDQFASVHGRAGHAMLLDCRSLEMRYVPLPDSLRLVICNTTVKHALSAGEYNTRRAECESAVQYFARFRPGIRALRDVNDDDLRRYGPDLPQVLFRRARHVVTENARVLKTAEALEHGNLREVGRLMYDSHISLRDDYEVSCPELDIMVEIARQIPGVIGARMTGGGFGGCTVNLIELEAIPELTRRVRNEYHSATQIKPEIYVTSAASGAGRVI